jgi:hypothetical protein
LADTTEVDDWAPEEIPSQDRLFMRIERSFVRRGDFAPGAFRNHGDGMSTDWARYSTPDKTRSRGRVPENNGVIEMVVDDVRGVPGQAVKHTPDRAANNRAHTDVMGAKDTEARLKLKRIARWVQGFQLADA